MPTSASAIALTATLYGEAMRLGERARACFDDGSREAAARAALTPEARLTVATESLRVTARLLEIVAALIVRQADGVAPVRLRDDAPVPDGLSGGLARDIALGVRDLYLRTFPL